MNTISDEITFHSCAYDTRNYLIPQQLRSRIEENWNDVGPINISGFTLSLGGFKNCNRFPETLLILSGHNIIRK